MQLGLRVVHATGTLSGAMIAMTVEAKIPVLEIGVGIGTVAAIARRHQDRSLKIMAGRVATTPKKSGTSGRKNTQPTTQIRDGLLPSGKST